MSPRNLNVERVEKPIRMRVRRTCHRCQTTFGPDKVCVSCQHVRCKKCPRYPPARTKEEKEARAKAKAAGLAKPGQPAKKKAKSPPLTMPSRTGGQDLVRKPVRQRVRRTCHRCETLFIGDAKECTKCHHIRCKKCPRDPYVFRSYSFDIFLLLTVTDPSLRNTPMGIRAMRNLRPDRNHGPGESHAVGCDTPVISVRRCTSRGRKHVPVVGKRRDRRRFEIRMSNFVLLEEDPY
jgi:hypothetical protein